MNEYERITKSDFFDKLKIYLEDAIDRHPDFAKNKEQAICIILEEVGELAAEINNGQPSLARIELFHAIATLTRLYGMFLWDDILQSNTEAYLEGKCGKN